MTAPALTLEHVGKRPLTVNEARRLHPFARAARDKEYRTFFAVAARAAGWPHLDRVTVTFTPLHKDRRSPQDVAGCAPASKGALDGLVDAGVLDDDGPAFVRAVIFLPPDVCGRDGLRVTVTPEVGAA